MQESINVDTISIYLKKILDGIILILPSVDDILIRTKMLGSHNCQLFYEFHHNRKEKLEWLNNSLYNQDSKIFLELFDKFGNYEFESSFLNNGILSCDIGINDEENLMMVSYKAFDLYYKKVNVLNLKNKFGFNLSFLNIHCDVNILKYSFYGFNDKNVYLTILKNEHNIKYIEPSKVLFENIFIHNTFKDFILGGYNLVYLRSLEGLLSNGIQKIEKIVVNSEDINVETLLNSYDISLDGKRLIFYCNGNRSDYKSSLNKISNYLKSLSNNSFLSIEIFNILEEDGKVYTINTDIMKKFGDCIFHTDCSNFYIKEVDGQLKVSKESRGVY